MYKLKGEQKNKTISLIVISLLSLSRITPAVASNQNTTNTVDVTVNQNNIDLKEANSVNQLKDSDYVLVSSPSRLSTKADDYKSYKKFMKSNVKGVYLMSKKDALLFKKAHPEVKVEVSPT